MDVQYYKRLFISISGIYSVYLTFGLIQEKIYRYVSEDGSRFQYTSVLLFIQCLINFTIAVCCQSVLGKDNKQFNLNLPKKDLVGRAVVYCIKDKNEQCTIVDVDQKSGTVVLSFNMFGSDSYKKSIRDVENLHFQRDTLSDYWIYGVCYTLAMIFSNNALKHVSYPTQVLAKSCKMIPVLLAGTLFGTRKYTVKKYISVLIITVGIILFQLMSDHKKVSTQANSNLGLVLLVLSLCMDGVCGMQQDVVVPRFKPSSLRLQEMLNVYGVLVSFVASLFLQELKPGLTFLLKNRVCLGYAVLFGVCSSVGQMFILYTVRHFPPLVLSTITTTRKFFSILLSVLFMGNEINVWQWCGVVLVFFGISFDKLGKSKKTKTN
ncbi:hypothetical protein WA577_006442, partial [Blastocystis sp. JDR]